MEQSIHTRINWLDANEMQTLIENAGFACNGSSEDEIREEFRELVSTGDIPTDAFD